MKLEDLTLDVEQRIDIKAAPDKGICRRAGKVRKEKHAAQWGITGICR